MNTTAALLAAAAIQLSVPLAAAGQAGIHFQTDFPPEEFKARWEQVFAGIGDHGVALLAGAPLARGFTMPRQFNEFYYLCGVETPHSYLLLDGRTKKVTLLLPPRNERLERAEGRVLSAEDADLAKQLTGVDEVASTAAMVGDWMGNVLRARGTILYTPFTPMEAAAEPRYELQAFNAGVAADYWDGRPSREAQLIQLIRTRYPRAEVKDLTPITDAMRAVKTPREVALIRRASVLAAHGILEAIRSTKSGMFEYQLDAAARYVHLVNGARLEGYRSIAAAGTANIWNMHYYRNLDSLKDGDLVLLDFAPEVGYYVSDITRMWPVSGKFSPVQRELLQFVLEYRNAIMKRIRPGVTAKAIMDEAKTAMEPVFQRTKFSKPIYEAAARKLVETGGGVFSHPVGMTVHDDGEYAPGPLKPGHVFSIDPQLWVPEEKLYLRYEDVIVITEKGYENFTEFLPTELDDIEKLVGKGGVVQKSPPLP
jgi:Xaa-Pro aminopeptidase